MPRNSDIFLNARGVRDRVLFSLQHVTRLEAADSFPERIHLGASRVAWSLQDILAWMQSKVDQRDLLGRAPRRVFGPDDRFIGKKELRRLVLYSSQHVRKLEAAGQFPRRVRIGLNRVAWLESEISEWSETRRRGTASSE